MQFGLIDVGSVDCPCPEYYETLIALSILLSLIKQLVNASDSC